MHYFCNIIINDLLNIVRLYNILSLFDKIHECIIVDICLIIWTSTIQCNDSIIASQRMTHTYIHNINKLELHQCVHRQDKITRDLVR